MSTNIKVSDLVIIRRHKTSENKFPKIGIIIKMKPNKHDIYRCLVYSSKKAFWYTKDSIRLINY